jgi:hypothetical protein
MTIENSPGGTGAKLARAVVIVAGIASLVASLLSFVYGKVLILPSRLRS